MTPWTSRSKPRVRNTCDADLTDAILDVRLARTEEVDLNSTFLAATTQAFVTLAGWRRWPRPIGFLAPVSLLFEFRAAGACGSTLTSQTSLVPAVPDSDIQARHPGLGCFVFNTDILGARDVASPLVNTGSLRVSGDDLLELQRSSSSSSQKNVAPWLPVDLS
ncbi:hypothetical protein MTO96_009836 [Rhipicephalus appendiculatus]